MDYLLISQRESKNTYGSFIDSLEHAYIEFFTKSLELPVIPVPNVQSDSTLSLIKESKGFILSGGGDIHEGNRNLIEMNMISESMKGTPLLGICHGTQLISIFFGGSIRKIDGHVSIKHRINADLLGKRWDDNVNSYHNYGIFFPGELIPFAFHNESIEGLIHKDYPIIGIMWHPERESVITKSTKIVIERFKNEIYSFSSRKR